MLIQERTEMEFGLAKLIDRRPPGRGDTSGLVVVPVVDPSHLRMLAMSTQVSGDFLLSRATYRALANAESGLLSSVRTAHGALPHRSTGCLTRAFWAVPEKGA